MYPHPKAPPATFARAVEWALIERAARADFRRTRLTRQLNDANRAAAIVRAMANRAISRPEIWPDTAADGVEGTKNGR